MFKRILVAYDGSEGAAEDRFDLLIIGYHGHRRIFERTMGSTAQSIVRHAPCAVLVAK